MTAPVLAVVIPTRNRAALAIEACRSLIAQTGCNHHVFVSDNSTDPAQISLLEGFCRTESSARLTYLRPPSPLRMPPHWDWAIGQALNRQDVTHVTVHYDRRVTKAGHLARVCDTLARHPELLCTWSVDQVITDAGRYRLWQTPWTGQLYAMRTSRVLQLTIEGRIDDMGQAFPILSNCAVPRAALTAIHDRFGSFCDSTGPDSCFTYRFCATHDRYVHFDCATGIVHAYERSNGSGYLRGRGGDFGDFVQTWGDRPWLEAAPIPGINLGQNMLFHEYELVRRATSHPDFKPLDTRGYLQSLASGLVYVEDPERRAQFTELLRRHGWSAEADPRAAPSFSRRMLDGGTSTIRRATARAKWALARLVSGADSEVTGLHGRSFETDAEAVRRALDSPRARSRHNPYLEPMNGVLLESPSTGRRGAAA
jgi:hypothetical protein